MTFFLLACTAGDPVDTGGAPSLRIVTPREGDTTCGTPLHVEVEVQNFELVPPGDSGDVAEPGTGHVDITLNGQEAAMSWEATTDIGGVSDGAWQLKAELSNADHSPVDPYVGQFIYITVSSGAC